MKVLVAEGFVDDIERGLCGLAELFEGSGDLTFATLRGPMERLEKIIATKSFLDAAFAYICERDSAGREVGSPYASEYLKERLGLSAAEAYERLSRGRELFAPPEPPPSGEPAGGGASEEQDGLDLGFGGSSGGLGEQPAGSGEQSDDAVENAADEAARQKRSRKNSRDISAEKGRIIQRCLSNLTADAACERAGIFEKATEAAKIRTPEDLRKYVDRLVANANRKHKPACDPNAAWDQRTLFFKADEASGKHTIIINTTAAFAALLKAHVDAGLPANSNTSKQGRESGERDYRTPGQRRHDELIHILQNWERHRQSDRDGAASIVLALTAEDLEEADAATKFQTNTGIELTPAELLRLGATGNDFVLQLDTVTGLPVSLGRTRLANVHQRIALLALQGVCAWEGCSRPMTELEIHHLHAYSFGGDTDLANLIGLCRTHHRANNDHRDGRDGRRHVDRDPGGSGEVGVVHADGSFHVNETQGHTDSAGYKIRHRHNRPAPNRAGRPHTPDPPLFPTRV